MSGGVSGDKVCTRNHVVQKILLRDSDCIWHFAGIVGGRGAVHGALIVSSPYGFSTLLSVEDNFLGRH